MKIASTSSVSQRPPLILASGSPRRRELLLDAGYEFTVVPANEDVECGVCSESGPAGLVMELAFRKASAVWEQLIADGSSRSLDPRTIILAADTVADLDGFVLGKPRDESHAQAMLSQLSGRDHRVLTGVCLWPFSPPLPLGEGRGEGVLTQVAKIPIPPRLLSFARELRKNQTDAETLMWSLLRNRSLGDFKFRRQHPIEPFILDFYCHERRLAIELDGGQHNTSVGRCADERRTAAIKEHGIRLLRYWNHDVLQDTDTVLEAIWNALHVPDASLTPGPSPKGRGRKEGGPIVRVAVTKLRMDRLSDAQLDEYLDSGQWEGKAGSFGYQDRLGWVHIVEGSESNVVGLPMELLAEMLAELNG